MSSNGEVQTIDQPLDYAVIEHVIGTGDLSKLTTAGRVAYYNKTCQTLGLNPLTRPMRFLSFQGSIVLYFTRDGCDQLRKVHNITLDVVNQKLDADLFIVTVRATMPNGRHDEDMGAVTLGKLMGEARANATMKAVTKAKRRVTLSICGLGMNEESEIETLPGARTFAADEEIPATPPPPPAPVVEPRQRRTVNDVLEAIGLRLRSAQNVAEIDALEQDENVLAINRLPTDHRAHVLLADMLRTTREQLSPPLDPLPAGLRDADLVDVPPP